MRISIATISKLLIIAGLVLKYGCIPVGLGLFGLAIVFEVIGSLLQQREVSAVRRYGA